MHSPRPPTRDSRRNALVGWTGTTIVALTAIQQLLTGAYLWSGLATLVVVALALPAVATGSPTAMVPWPLPSVAAVAVVLRAVEFSPDVSGYLAISSIALILVVELHAYTAVSLSRRFAVVFATMTTLSLQALWIVAQYYSDRWLETGFLTSQVELQWDIVYVTVVSVLLAVFVEWSLERFDFGGAVDGPPSRPR